MSDNLKAVFIILMFLLFNNHSFIINAEQTPSPITISISEDDLTGDKQHETIQLKGSLLHDNSSFYQNIWIEIKSIHSEKWKIPFTGGYDPHIQLLDLTQDQVNDLFYQSALNKNDHFYTHHLYSLKNGVIKEVSLPKQSHIKGHSRNDFQIEIQTSIRNENPIMIEVNEFKNKYVEHGIYDTKGNLLEQAPIMIAPVSKYEPLLINKSKGYGLKSYQKISGGHTKDPLGVIEIDWYYENGAWVILQTDWVPNRTSN